MGKGPSRPHKQPAANKPPANKPPVSKPPASEPAAPTPAGPGPARTPRSSTLPLTSRTTTLDDPLTTSLLAEIARRPSTVEMSPAQLAKARAMVPGAPEPEDGEDRDPDDPA